MNKAPFDATPPQKLRVVIGQAVAWSASPTGFAQVEDLHRCCVTIGYRRQGRWRRVRIRVARLVAEPMLFELDNPFCRGLFARSKVFEVSA